ncbi:MAG: flagellar basal body-associated FliL family protein [Sideroxydans sp.]|jgi:flagellar FliL protein
MSKTTRFTIMSLLTLLAVALFSMNANASGGGGGGEGGVAYERVEPLTVNLMGAQQYLQVTITLKLAKPEAGEKVKLHMPVIRNNMIYLLSGKSAEEISNMEGKKRLLVESRDAVNKAIGLEAAEGVADVLFETFIIQ